MLGLDHNLTAKFFGLGLGLKTLSFSLEADALDLALTALVFN